MDWYALTLKYHKLSAEHDYRLQDLETDWQRELAAIYRLEADVNNGGYLQFVANWKRENYEFALQGLVSMGATQMAEIVRESQSLLDRRFDAATDVFSLRPVFFQNRILDQFGNLVRVPRLFLPRRVRDRIWELSYAFMSYPDRIDLLGEAHYSPLAREA